MCITVCTTSPLPAACGLFAGLGGCGLRSLPLVAESFRPRPGVDCRHATFRIEHDSSYAASRGGRGRCHQALGAGASTTPWSRWALAWRLCSSTLALAGEASVGEDRLRRSDTGGDHIVSAADQLLTADDLAERWQVPKSHVFRLT